MLGTLLMYWMVGIIVCNLAILIHLLTAEIQGYRSFEYWGKVLPEFEVKLTASQLLWSMCIWPIRLWQFIAIASVFYDGYDRRKYRPRRRR